MTKKEFTESLAKTIENVSKIILEKQPELTKEQAIEMAKQLTFKTYEQLGKEI